MPKSRLDTLKDFMESPPGTNWYRVNLHVHASGQDPEMIVDAAIRAGLTLVAITDHNTFKFVRPVQDAAKRIDGNLVPCLRSSFRQPGNLGYLESAVE